MKQIGSFHSAQWGTVFVMRANYGSANGPTAIALELADGEPLSKLSVNMPGMSERLPPGCFYVKAWSENEVIAREAAASGLFKLRDDLPQAESGFVTAPVWEIVA